MTMIKTEHQNVITFIFCPKTQFFLDYIQFLSVENFGFKLANEKASFILEIGPTFRFIYSPLPYSRASRKMRNNSLWTSRHATLH